MGGFGFACVGGRKRSAQKVKQNAVLGVMPQMTTESEQARDEADRAEEEGYEASEASSDAASSSAGSSNSSSEKDEAEVGMEAVTEPIQHTAYHTKEKKKLPPVGEFVAGKIDSGCTTTILSAKVLAKLKKASEAISDTASVTSKGSAGSTYKFADGLTRTAADQVMVRTECNGEECEIFANVFNDNKTPFLLGLNFLRRHKVTITYDAACDRISCPLLDLDDQRLPRDRSGLSILPFACDYQGVLKKLKQNDFK